MANADRCRRYRDRKHTAAALRDMVRDMLPQIIQEVTALLRHGPDMRDMVRDMVNERFQELAEISRHGPDMQERVSLDRFPLKEKSSPTPPSKENTPLPLPLFPENLSCRRNVDAIEKPQIITETTRHIAERMVAIWHEAVCPPLPRVAKLTQKRTLAAWRRFEDSFHRSLDEWRAFLVRVKASPHLTGANDRGWKADFDFCLREDKILNTIEGRYDAKHTGDAAAVPQRRRPKSPPPRLPDP